GLSLDLPIELIARWYSLPRALSVFVSRRTRDVLYRARYQNSRHSRAGGNPEFPGGRSCGSIHHRVR
ncbi:hypothetical protein, partial [Pseudomonas viridiflava]|uniref:hypothetical protein n=1 Tax=Pseudomonas viridiflava TaxID=33069 RepID=UPI00197EC753